MECSTFECSTYMVWNALTRQEMLGSAEQNAYGRPFYGGSSIQESSHRVKHSTASQVFHAFQTQGLAFTRQNEHSTRSTRRSSISRWARHFTLGRASHAWK